MKIGVLLITLTWFTIAHGQSVVEIPAGSRVTIGYPDSEDAALALKNKSSQGIDVATINKVSGVQQSGFGLGPFGKATVAVSPLDLLELRNTSNEAVRLSYEITKAVKNEVGEDERYISFTLRNETLKSIPLVIPGVMNPNLSPQSNSGVRLKIGQEIKYKKGGRAHLLLIVDNSIKEGDVLFIGERIAQVND
ncbi:MAG: hypothetical protein ACPG3S_01700 [Schleiferiaceae bacterium]